MADTTFNIPQSAHQINNFQKESKNPLSPENNRLKVMDDIDGNPIYEGDRFTFEWDNNVKIYCFRGYFYWNQSELRYEINIEDNQLYTCLSYNSDTMKKFKITPKKSL